MFRRSNLNKTVKFFLVSLKYREIKTIKTVTLYKNLYFFSLKVLKAIKEGGTNFVLFMSVEKYGWAIQKSLFA